MVSPGHGGRRRYVLVLLVLTSVTLISLDQAWYSQYQRVPFHGFDDGPEWMGFDKAGHVFATYTVGSSHTRPRSKIARNSSA